MKGTIKIEEYIIPYKIIYNDRLKYMRLYISEGGIKISTRRGVSKNIIEDFIYRKSHWILKNYIRLKEVSAKTIESSWVQNERLLYGGKSCKVTIKEFSEKKCKVEFASNEFEIFVPKAIDGEKRIENIETAIELWYRKEAKKIINDRLLLYSKRMSVIYNQFRIKEQKTRWGSCSKRKNLNFNWKIIMAPEAVMDYVIIHELCHLVHFNHSKEFWSLVSFYMPNYKEQETWLKNNGINLHI